MKWGYLILLLFIVACTEESQGNLPPGETALPVVPQAQNLSADAPAVMPALDPMRGEQDPSGRLLEDGVAGGSAAGAPDDAPARETEQDTPAVSADVSADAPSAAPATLSYTEDAERRFLALNRSYLYLADLEGFGELWVIHMDGRIKYTSPDHLYELRDGVVVPSAWELSNRAPPFLDQIRRRELLVMDYITFENGSYYGCYVATGYYTRDSCLWDNTTEQRPIIHEGFSFTPPEGPLDWLRRFHGRTPTLIRYNYTNREDNLVRMVDHVYFTDPDGTTTQLIMHQGYHVPVQVLILGPDNRTKQTIKFQYLETDLTQMKRRAPWFFED